MDISIGLIALSVAVLLSYWYLHLGRQLRFPSVVFLLLTGLALRVGSDVGGFDLDLPPGLLPTLGTIGLILIVLEGALDLNLAPGRGGFVRRTFGAALLGVLGTTAGVAAVMALSFGLGWREATLLAIPFAVISSAVAIPSAEALGAQQREFVIYESSWSDILGVMLFNAALVALATGRGFTLNLVGGGLAVLLLGAALGLAMTWLVSHLEGHVKFLPLIFALILVYGAAKAVDLSPLLIVLVLGLMLNNPQLLQGLAQRWKSPQRASAGTRSRRLAVARRILGRLLGRLHSDHFDSELDKLKHLTAEATFLVRTFFFLLLGYETDLAELADPRAWGLALLLVALIFGLRWPLMRWLSGDAAAQPLVWAAPRGLITVLLFLSLPESVVPADFPTVVLILVVVISSLVMAAGFRRAGAADEDSAPAAASDPGVIAVGGPLTAAPSAEHGPPDQPDEEQQRRERLDNQQPHDRS
jgi:NhaP-type Na+/H+ or K+/H+ antiporter